MGLFLYKKKWLQMPLWEPVITSYKHCKIVLIILVFIFFVKGFYLSNSILPTTTDLGHHLYWAQTISLDKKLPVYEKQEILRDSNNHYSLGNPEPIADFIVGEHLALAVIALFTGASFIGIFPFLFLFLLNLLALLALTVLAFRIGQKITTILQWKHVTAEWFFIGGLFLFGVLFTLASPEMKFVSGGVIGNLFGNFFLPLILLFLLRALEEKSPLFLMGSLVLITSIAYTHHLSTFILAYILVAFGLVLILFLQKDFLSLFGQWFRLVFTRPLFWFFLSLIFFATFVALPTYLETSAVSTAVGTPTKDTRTGLSLFQLSASNSPLKVGASFFALCLIIWLRPLRKSLSGILLFAWGTVLLVMALAPQLLFVNIPSNRIGGYTSFPLSLLTLFALLFLIETLLRQRTLSKKIPLLQAGFMTTAVFFGLTIVSPGFFDNANTLGTPPEGQYVKQTFTATEYLYRHSSITDKILKDHNFIEAGDTWMKLFFNRGYNYPFSRSFFKRYEDNPQREQCTLAMISTPNTTFGKQCYQDLNIRFIVVNPKYDRAQFQKSPSFSLIYHSPDIAIFEHLKQ
jgi:hypothetical protein